MRLFFILLVILAALHPVDLIKLCAPLSASMQEMCAELLPFNLKHRGLAQSFLCGVPINNAEAKDSFRATGLLHLMVVSGSHLQFLAFFFLLPWPRKWRGKIWLRTGLSFFLLFYCFSTGFQAPVVRAFLSRGFSSLNQNFKWHWDLGKVQLCSGVFLLALIPNWIFSFSFFLSWLASLGFLLTPLYFRHERWERNFPIVESLITCALIQAFMAVCFSQFSILGVLMNAFIAPLLALILFPLSFISILFPSLNFLIDGCWDLLLVLLAWTSEAAGTESPPFSLNNTGTERWLFLWAFLAAIHCFFEWLRRTRYRNSNV